MSILIKRMVMPNSCGNCPLRRSNENRVWCSVIGGYIDFSKEYDCRRDDCPLVEIPTPHGDLVDRSELLAEYDSQHKGPAGGARKIMVDAKAVIEAEGKGK